jgi:hypothetical protein
MTHNLLRASGALATCSGLAPPGRMAEPVRRRLRSARSRALTSPETGPHHPTAATVTSERQLGQIHIRGRSCRPLPSIGVDCPIGMMRTAAWPTASCCYQWRGAGGGVLVASRASGRGRGGARFPRRGAALRG